jgi:hypothetical protein
VNLVTRGDVGEVALNRMIRDRVVIPLAPGFAAALDLPVTRVDRAATLGDSIPGHTVVSGLAGLWVHHGGPRPIAIDLVGVRGLHRSPPDFHPSGWRWNFHSGSAASEAVDLIGGIHVAKRERCVVDALRWDDLAAAIPAIVGALDQGSVTAPAIRARIEGEDSRGLGATRMRSAWAAIEVTLGRGRAS